MKKSVVSREKRRALLALIAVTCAIAMSGIGQQLQAQQSSGAAKSTPTDAQAGANENDVNGQPTEQLQKAVQNPVANLISAPLQNSANFGVGPYDRTQDVLNFQPVIPVKLGENWTLITRVIQPFVWQPYPAPTTGEYGLGDMNPTFFLSPQRPGKVIWGAGPAFIIPTATNKILGQGKFSMGPSFVALTQPGPWTLGVLVNNVWSVAGSGGRPAVNQMLLQYFVNYNLKKGWYISLSPIITANWKASGGNVWTVPFGGGIGRVTKIGFQPVNITAQFYSNPVRPAGSSSWSMRLQIAFLFPKLSKEQQTLLMEQKLKQLQKEKQ